MRRFWPVYYLAALLAFTMFSKSTIAWRYLLPAIPFLFGAAAAGLAALLLSALVRE